jgi:potassium-transporting ATPase KdpC subunit
MRRDLVTGALAVVIFTVLFGIAYPLLVTGAAQVAFPNRADGSRIERDGRTVGSRLIGQDFQDKPQYFQSRPSVTEYSPNATFFENQGPNQDELAIETRRRARQYLRRERRYDRGLQRADLPVDAVTASASGVDPHISKRNAEIQARRVAIVRRMPPAQLRDLIDEHTDDRALGILGSPGVNVLELNLALDQARA